MGQKRKLELLGEEVLKDPMVEPKNSVLENILGKKYKLYSGFVEEIGKLELIPEWNYYNDTKSWLCKILGKSKNYCWLSVLDKGIKLTFYFTKETINGIYEMNINEKIKNMAKEYEIGRKNPPVVLLVENNETLNDALKIINYKNEYRKMSAERPNIA